MWSSQLQAPQILMVQEWKGKDFLKRILPLRNSNIAYRSPWILPEAYEKTTPVELQLMYCRFILDHASQFEDIYSEECQKFMKSYQAYKEFVSTHEEEQSKKEPLQLRGQERVQGPFFGSTNNHILRNSWEFLEKWREKSLKNDYSSFPLETYSPLWMIKCICTGCSLW